MRPVRSASARPCIIIIRSRSARKVYWAVVAGVPRVRQGRVSTYLAKEELGEGDARFPDSDLLARQRAFHSDSLWAASRSASVV